jgi:hypothetical protein
VAQRRWLRLETPIRRSLPDRSACFPCWLQADVIKFAQHFTSSNLANFSPSKHLLEKKTDVGDSLTATLHRSTHPRKPPFFLEVLPPICCSLYIGQQPTSNTKLRPRWAVKWSGSCLRITYLIARFWKRKEITSTFFFDRTITFTCSSHRLHMFV